jgi:hypothetical protein
VVAIVGEVLIVAPLGAVPGDVVGVVAGGAGVRALGGGVIFVLLAGAD